MVLFLPIKVAFTYASFYCGNVEFELKLFAALFAPEEFYVFVSDHLTML